jgi:hypothetical protein
VSAPGLALASILAACGGEDTAQEDPGTSACPDGQHDGGDGACQSEGACSPGYHLTDFHEGTCSLIEPGTIRYLGPNGPVAGVSVVFHDSSGGLLGRGETDAAGELSSLLPLTTDRGLVTVVFPDADVKVGGSETPTLQTERLWVWDDHTFRGPHVAEPTAELVITLPGAVAGAATYVVDAGLVESGELVDPAQPVVLTLPESELAELPAVIATALDREGVPLAWSAAVAPRGPDIALDPWSDAFTDVDVTVYNPPPGASGFAYFAVTMFGREYAMRPRIDIPPDAEGDPPAPVVHRVAQVSERAVLVAGFEQPPIARGIYADPTWYFEAGSELDVGVVVDLSADLLPVVDTVTIRPGDPGSPGRPTLSWSAEPVNWRSAIVALRYSSATRSELWSIPATERDVDTIRVPELPADLATRAPTDITGASLEVSLINGYPGSEVWDLYGPRSDSARVSPAPDLRTSPPDPRLWGTTTRR